jgi:hypothetical protein
MLVDDKLNTVFWYFGFDIWIFEFGLFVVFWWLNKGVN